MNSILKISNIISLGRTRRICSWPSFRAEKGSIPGRAMACLPAVSHDAVSQSTRFRCVCCQDTPRQFMLCPYCAQVPEVSATIPHTACIVGSWYSLFRSHFLHFLPPHPSPSASSLCASVLGTPVIIFWLILNLESVHLSPTSLEVPNLLYISQGSP